MLIKATVYSVRKLSQNRSWQKIELLIIAHYDNVKSYIGINTSTF